MATFEFIQSLLFWLYQNEEFLFEWDEGNTTKNELKHKVRRDEIEEVFYSGSALPLGIQILPLHSEDRFGVVGSTFQGRILHIVFTIREEKTRVISARVANKKERIKYETSIREIQKRI